MVPDGIGDRPVPAPTQRLRDASRMTFDERGLPSDTFGIKAAAGHAATAIPVAHRQDSVDAVLASMRGRHFDSAAVIAVCEADLLTGLVTIERLLAAAPGSSVADVMDPAPPSVAPGVDQERAAWEAVRHDEAALAVVDADGRLRGVIPPQRLLAVLLEEHDEDMARLGGFLGSTASARAASEEAVARRLWHRLPWLLVGLVGALLSAGIVAAFERDLQRQVLIAFFVPGVVYLADAAGAQTVTLIVRGLSIGVGIRRVAARETVTGVVIGVLLAVVVFPLIIMLWGDAEVAGSVALALFVTCAIAPIVAMALPWLFNRLGHDPAFGSGPLATVVQDLLSITVYFAVASAIVS